MESIKKSMGKSYVVPLSITLVFVILGSLYFYLSLSRPELIKNLRNKMFNSGSEQSAASPTPTPVPTRSPYPLKADKGTAGTFIISQSHKEGPIFTNFVIDPIVPQTEKDIKITVTIKSDSELTSLTAKITGDKDPIPLEMTRVSRSKNIETWTSTFKLTKPVDYTYIFNFIANDGTNNIIFDLPLRTD